MRKTGTMIALLLISGFLYGQELPKLSPLAKAEYQVGLNHIHLQYSRPSVRGRVIFGDLLPYNEIWRLGANEPTRIVCSEPIRFENNGKEQVLPADTFAIFAFPGEDMSWKVVFNTNYQQWGAGSYDASKDVVTLNVKAVKNNFTETLLIDINDITPTSASIVIAWENLKVVIPFTVDTDKSAQANIDKAIAEGKDLDRVYFLAANYFFGTKKDNTRALEYIDQSLAIEKTHFALFLKARILHENGDKKEAVKLAKEAKALAEEANAETWIGYIDETLQEWEK